MTDLRQSENSVLIGRRFSYTPSGTKTPIPGYLAIKQCVVSGDRPAWLIRDAQTGKNIKLTVKLIEDLERQGRLTWGKKVRLRKKRMRGSG